MSALTPNAAPNQIKLLLSYMPANMDRKTT